MFQLPKTIQNLLSVKYKGKVIWFYFEPSFNLPYYRQTLPRNVDVIQFRKLEGWATGDFDQLGKNKTM
ncbi:hypothetical protein B0E43_00145 [Algoriphagus sp. A40]|nr:hypothetical protein B0E43_00145 [Algoriphagus sp. A40]